MHARALNRDRELGDENVVSSYVALRCNASPCVSETLTKAKDHTLECVLLSVVSQSSLVSFSSSARCTMAATYLL